MSAEVRSSVARDAAIPSGVASLRDELWGFALAFYGREEASRACLVLQERIGADVDIILFGLFTLLRRGASLGAEDLAEIDTLVTDWRTEIVRPLRQLRTRLKSGPPPAPTSATDALRNRVKAIEIEAERIELDMLADWLASSATRRDAGTADPSEWLAVMARHFAAAARARLDDPQVQDALRLLARAASEFAAGTAPPTDPHPG
jgi:uncharacterized protein (TIGR02444 family)